jgi:hypothetical protein
VEPQTLEASFRDPSGFIFTHGDGLYRQINSYYRENYDRLMESGLYQRLVDSGHIIPHSEVDLRPPQPETAYKVILPERVDFVSYPYEWSFSQLKHAALATLEIQKQALDFGMSLKDASAYNIQFHQGRPVLIDTLSFQIYREGRPWDAYRQFCQHFLGPLSLMAYRDALLNKLMRTFIDGIPLDMVSKLLPFRTRLSIPLLLHIHLHSASQKRYSSREVQTTRQMNLTSFRGLIDSLESGVKKLQGPSKKTQWSQYYQADHNYSPEGMAHKEELVGSFLDIVKPDLVWDLGANVGKFSRIASQRGMFTVAFDVDPGAVESNYLDCNSRNEAHILPLIMDFTNPSAAIGWRNRERASLVERGPADLVMALALVHHLAIANNVPLGQIAEFFRDLGSWLIVEFVPKDDSQVQRMLSTRKDIFPDYTPQRFEDTFSKLFIIHKIETIRGSRRILYLMEKRESPRVEVADL